MASSRPEIPEQVPKTNPPARRSILARAGGFVFGTCSGISGLEDAIDHFTTDNAFFLFDETTNGVLVRGQGGGWFKRRTFTVFLLKRFLRTRMEDRREKLEECRALFASIVSRIIADEHRFGRPQVWFDTSAILSKEFGGTMLNDCTGLFFTINMDEPTELTIKTDEWTDLKNP